MLECIGLITYRVEIYFVDNIRGVLWCMESSNTKGWSTPIGEGILGLVAETGETIMVRDAYNDQRFDRSLDERSGYRTQSLICAAVKDMDSEPIALIQAVNKLSSDSKNGKCR